jgi:hypothetical protein
MPPERDSHDRADDFIPGKPLLGQKLARYTEYRSPRSGGASILDSRRRSRATRCVRALRATTGSSSSARPTVVSALLQGVRLESGIEEPLASARGPAARVFPSLWA